MFDFLIGGDGKTYVKLMVSILRTCVLCLQYPSGWSKLSTIPSAAGGYSSKVRPPGLCVAEDEERRARNLSGVREGRGGPQTLLLNTSRGRFPAIKSKENKQ